MPHENPFLKPPSKPANKDTAAFVESVLGKKEGDKARVHVGSVKKEKEFQLESPSLQLTAEEKAKAEEYEKKRPWTREQVVEWAVKLGWDEAWVDKMFSFNADKSITIDESFPFGNVAGYPQAYYGYATGITELLAGISEVDGDLDLSESKITNLENIPRAIRGSLKLNDTKIKSLRGLQNCNIGEDIFLVNTPLSSLEGIPPAIYGSLNLAGSKVSNLDALKSVIIGGYLSLLNIPATSMQAGSQVKDKIYVYGSQSALIESLRKNGYGDKLDIK